MDVADCFLDGNADVVEFCPHRSFQHLLAAATYTLEEGDHPSRSGSISIFDVNADAGGVGLNLLHKVETAGIFDMKWNPVGDNVCPLLAQADADGHLRLHRIENPGDGTVAKGEFGCHFLDFWLLISNFSPLLSRVLFLVLRNCLISSIRQSTPSCELLVNSLKS